MDERIVEDGYRVSAEFYDHVVPYRDRGDIPFLSTLRGELIYRVASPDGDRQTLVHPFALPHLFRFETEHLLTRCGFVLEEVYSGYDKSPFGSTYPGRIDCRGDQTRIITVST